MTNKTEKKPTTIKRNNTDKKKYYVPYIYFFILISIITTNQTLCGETLKRDIGTQTDVSFKQKKSTRDIGTQTNALFTTRDIGTQTEACLILRNRNYTQSPNLTHYIPLINIIHWYAKNKPHHNHTNQSTIPTETSTHKTIPIVSSTLLYQSHPWEKNQSYRWEKENIKLDIIQ